MSRVRLGAVGAGWWATSNHFPIFAGRDDVELVGVCGKGRSSTRCASSSASAWRPRTTTELLDPGPRRGRHHDAARPALRQRGRGDRARTARAGREADRRCDAARGVGPRRARASAPACTSSCPTAGTTSPSRSRRTGCSRQDRSATSSTCSATWPRRRAGCSRGDPTHITQLWDSETGRPRRRRRGSRPAHGGGYAHGQITHSSALLFWLTGLRAASVAGACRSRRRGRRPVRRRRSSRFDGGALGSLSGAATLADGDPYQVDIRLFGTEGVLHARHRARARCRCTATTDGARSSPSRRARAPTSASCRPTASSTSSPARAPRTTPTPTVAARSVELIDALLRSSAAGGVDAAV